MDARTLRRGLIQFWELCSGSQDFVYNKPLDWRQQEIRLIEILPEADSTSVTQDSPIILKLHHVSLLDAPAYTALSYTWGDQNERKHISLDGRGFEISGNVEDALREIRRESIANQEASTMLWIDQISINQSDDLEKKDQVQNMDMIYSQAKDVFIWTGKADEETPTVFTCLSQLASRAKEIGIEDYMTTLTHQTQEETSLDVAIIDLISSASCFEESNWLALDRFFYRPWWKRAWVVQEALLAQSACIACGDERLDWVDMTRILAAVMLFCYRLRFLPADVFLFKFSLQQQIAVLVSRISLFFPVYEESDLDNVLAVQHMSLSGRLATDPRDHVYSLLAFMTKQDRAQITVRYDESWACRDLYSQVTELLLKQAGLQILQDVMPNHDHSTLGLPSWVLDFSNTDTQSKGESVGRDSNFTCGGSMLEKPNLQFLREEKLLRVSAGQVDTIKIVADVFPHYIYGIDNDVDLNTKQKSIQYMLELRAWIDALKRIVKDDLLIASLEVQDRYEDALWRMCILDYFGNTKPDEIHKGFMALMGQTQPPKDYCGDLLDWQLEASAPFVRQCHIRGQTPFITSSGFPGLARHAVAVGDSICILKGSRVPFVLHGNDDGRYSLKSEAYMHGIMYGEIFLDEFNLDQWEDVDIC